MHHAAHGKGVSLGTDVLQPRLERKVMVHNQGVERTELLQREHKLTGQLARADVQLLCEVSDSSL